MSDHKSEQQFEAEQDVRTMIDVGKLRKDKARMKRMTAEAKRQKAALEDMEIG